MNVYTTLELLPVMYYASKSSQRGDRVGAAGWSYTISNKDINLLNTLLSSDVRHYRFEAFPFMLHNHNHVLH